MTDAAPPGNTGGPGERRGEERRGPDAAAEQQPVPRQGRPMVAADRGQVTSRRAVAVLYHCSELRALSPLQEREIPSVRRALSWGKKL